MEKQAVCPFCNEGIIEKTQIIQTGDIVYVCDECDTLWENQNFNSLFCSKDGTINNYLTKRGIPLIGSIKVLEEQEQK